MGGGLRGRGAGARSPRPHHLRAHRRVPIILPLMFAVVLATAASSLLSRDTIYTLKLRRRGIDIRRGRGVDLMELLTVTDALQPVPGSLAPDMPLDAVIERLSAERRDALPVIDADGTYMGAVTSHEARESVQDNALENTAGELARSLPTLRVDQTLQEALAALVRHEGSGLPAPPRRRRAPRRLDQRPGRAPRLQRQAARQHPGGLGDPPTSGRRGAARDRPRSACGARPKACGHRRPQPRSRPEYGRGSA